MIVATHTEPEVFDERAERVLRAFGRHVASALTAARDRHRLEMILSAAGDGIIGMDTRGHATAAITTCESVRVTDEVFWSKDGTSFPVDYTAMPLREGGEVSGLVLTVRDTSELTRLAFHDALTGLPNRVLFIDRLQQALARSERLGTHVRAQLRTVDTAARFGGDEFTVLVESAGDPADAMGVAARLAAVLRESFVLEGHEVVATASIGIATATDRETAEDLLRNSDLAMYRAKGSGKDRCAMFDPSLNASAWRRLALESDLPRALERDELYLVLQPIVRLFDGSIRGAEGLLRWRHPTLGAVAPNDFLPLAEETGLNG